ncbi:hypothetical protein [Youngiibacter fragilis]|uniref:Uncharacterized protein n=1 Tax=Youngiibacter fragilis 232.1 TaxID=994573 RepID=V7ICL2_9CLOT|nr:hypothetical protein [Youngiibacter fragilis]ETA82592.1 hypothetical protein T472_0200185 [Youngiibacter fragilis 232.1]
MNNMELKARVAEAMDNLISAEGYAAPVDVLIEIGILSKKDHDEWRSGKVQYLERVCRANLSKLSLVMHEVRSYAVKNGLKPSWTAYIHKGKPLRFSKSSDEKIERSYATHFVRNKKAD